MANLDDRITVFIKDGVPCGTCPAGHEAEWASVKDEQRHPYDSTRSSTEGRWKKYARARCSKEFGGPGMSTQEAMKYL